MAKGKMIVMTNPASAAREADFNQWYNEIHAVEVVSLPGFKSMTRYRTKLQMLPRSDTPQYGYAAIYEMDDVDLALKSMKEAAPRLRMTDAINAVEVQQIVIEPIFTYSK